MKTFYHNGDFDGACSAAIIKYMYPECQLFGINYGDEFPWNIIESGETVYVVDYSLQPYELNIQLDTLCNLILIDHHRTTIKAFKELRFSPAGTQIEGKAGCELTWEYILPDIPVPYGVTLLGRYDVWDHTDINTVPFQYGMRATEMMDPNHPDWAHLFDDDLDLAEIIDNGNVIIKYISMSDAQYMKAYAFEGNFEGYRALFLNRGICTSMTFESMWDPEKHDLMVPFSRLPSGQWTVSLYTTHDNIDCGVLAKTFGGGGHPQAAGFQCKELFFLNNSF